MSEPNQTNDPEPGAPDPSADDVGAVAQAAAAEPSVPILTAEATEAEPTAVDRVAALEVEKTEIRERMLRIAADFENYKKRARRDQAEAEQREREKVLRDFLEVVDNLDRAVAFGNDSDPVAISQGVQLVLRLFHGKLDRYDVRPIVAKGKPFDPRMHDAVAQVPTADVPPGTVVNELMRGYAVGDRLLRPATVAVAVALPSPAVVETEASAKTEVAQAAAAPDDESNDQET